MQVFVSWSGETSKRLAVRLESWLPKVLQNVNVFVSTGLPRGTFWAPNLATALEESAAGILCLTPDSVDSPWVLFEAGALGMGVKGRPVFGLLFGLDISDVPDPLQPFQLSHFSKEEMCTVLKSINSLSKERQVPEARILEALDLRWAELEEPVADQLKNSRRLKRLPFGCEELKDREALYNRIAKELDEKTDGWVHDTTWGKNPPDPLVPKERAALERYVKARSDAVARGVAYKEIFSFTPQRLKRVMDALADAQHSGGGYRVRVLEGVPGLSLPDFMAMDSGEVIISHVDADAPGGKRKYLLIKCQSVADFYHDWFEECWRSAIEPTLSDP